MSKKKEKEKNKYLNYFIYLIFLGLLILVYSHFIGTKGLFIREYAVSSNKLPKSFDGFKIVHFTDLHYGTTIKNKEMEKLINEINDLKPDIVVFTGDLIDQHYNIKEDEVITLANYFNRIDAKIGKYIVNGNHDISNKYYELLDKIDYIDMNNKNTLIYYNDNTPIILVGLDDYLEHELNIEDAFNYINENNYYTILLAHEPDLIDKVYDYGIDLMLSGHSHNGQVRIPFFGAVYTPVGSKKYYDAEYEINTTKIYISGGLGTSDAEFRLFVHPSFNFYRLYSN